MTTTTTTTHTPGPWTYEYSPYISEDGAEIPAFEVHGPEKVCDTNEDRPKEEQEANARLIAAAPELLAALKALHKQATLSENAFSAANVYAAHVIAMAEGGS